MNEDKEISEAVGLSVGSVVETKQSSYEILKILGEGGFGVVYKVKDLSDEKKVYAMKVEPRGEHVHNKLKMEIDILQRASQERDEPHFLHIIDRGKKADHFVFVVMDLVGASLADLKDRCPHRVFPIATGLGAGNQCLEAVEDLHKLGYIHRDLKPSNYACGRGTKSHVIYIFDFGIARKMITKKNVLKAQRGIMNFKGTIRYSSVRCHLNRDLSYSDDCESWLYMLLDLITEGGLPWKNLEEKDEVMNMKVSCRDKNSDLIAPKLACRHLLVIMMNYLGRLDYSSTVDYAFLYTTMKKCAQACHVDMDAPFCWEEEKWKESV